jgi:hypothetical protein
MNKKRVRANPYGIAVLTALLSGVVAVAGFYFTVKWQVENLITQKQYEYRSIAYGSFLIAINNKNKAPVFVEMIRIGELFEYVCTDEEVQSLEDRLGRFIQLNCAYKNFLELKNIFDILRLHGSNLVRKYCDEILLVLMCREYDVKWEKYPNNLILLKDKWVDNQENGIVYGWEEKVSNEERVMFVLLSAMYENLLAQMRNELYSEKYKN